MVVLDTKFTANSLISNRSGDSVFDPSHLYQLYAYLRYHEHVSDADRCASGVLLYPRSARSFEVVQLQGHEIHFVTIDLSQPWEEIEGELLDVISAGIA